MVDLTYEERLLLVKKMNLFKTGPYLLITSDKRDIFSSYSLIYG